MQERWALPSGNSLLKRFFSREPKRTGGTRKKELRPDRAEPFALERLEV